MKTHKADIKLAKALMKGNEKVFNNFFDEYHPRIFRFIMSRIDQDYDLAHDMAQDTLCKALEKIADYRGEAALFTWMCQISRSLIHAHFVKHKRRAQVVQPLADTEEMKNILENIAMNDQLQPEQLSMNLQLKQIIEEVLDHLPKDYGNVLTWKYVDDLSVNEIAAQLQTTQIAAQSILARARKSFQQVINKMLQHDTLRALIVGHTENHHG
ncbi:RNA polymerase sigma factor [Marinicella rhabdoformis]|uniref:RNA polymerase sigma factor n=1 Tax=Marinicella rhabdoformis TaxID=2580566 RepID=UPI0015D056FE|nr:RNA polymerase sigma factor [Marinicella rhabdoformis]